MSRKPSKILIMHGWQADSGSNWFPEAKVFLEKKGFEVFVPDNTGGYSPKLSEWLGRIEQNKPDENWILIGHSLGGVTILKYLEKTNMPVAQTILLATPINEMKFTPLKNFFEQGFDWEKIKQNGGKINLIYELDDQVVPLEHGHILAGKLSAPLTVVPGAIHICRMNVEIIGDIIDE